MANRFWVGGAGTWDSSSTTHWATSSGGSPGASVPVSSDFATFDANSGGGTVTPNYDMTLFNLAMGAFTGTLDFSVNNNNPTLGTFSGSGSGTRTLKMGSGTWNITGSFSANWNMATVSNLTFNAGTSTIKITDTSTSFVQLILGGLTYHNLWVARGSGTGPTQIQSNNTFNDIKDDGSAAHLLQFQNGTTQTVTTFTVSGVLGNLISLNSDTTGTYTLSKSSGAVQCQYLNIQHCIATGGATWDAGTTSTNNQAVTTAGSGWTFNNPPPVTVISPFPSHYNS